MTPEASHLARARLPPSYYVFLLTGDPINELSAKYDREKKTLLEQLGSHLLAQHGSHKQEGFGRSPAPVEHCVAHSAGKVQALERGGFLAEPRRGLERGWFLA